MQIGIISDSHDNVQALHKAVSLFNEAGVSLVLHAGDLVSPFTAQPIQQLHCRLSVFLEIMTEIELH